MARKPIKQATLKRLFALSGNQCAFPGCTTPMIDNDYTLLGEICHIEAAEKGGQRFNPSQSEEQRRSPENLILLCAKCHKKTDDVTKFRVDVLQKMKADHENKFLTNPYTIPESVEKRVLKEIRFKLDELLKLAQLSHKGIEKVQRTVEGVESNISAQLATGFEAMQQMMKSQLHVSYLNSDIHAKQLDFIKDFRADNQPQTALKALLRFKAQSWDDLTIELQYKVVANLGALLLDLRRDKEAADYFISLKNINWKEEAILPWICIGYSLLGLQQEFECYFDRALALSPKDINLWLSYIYINKNHKSIAEIEAKIPVEVCSQPQVAFKIGELYIESGETELGFEKLDSALSELEIAPIENWQTIANFKVKRLFYVATIEKINLGLFTEKELDFIRKTRDEFNQIWSFISNSAKEFEDAFIYILLDRGICNSILGEKSKAESDFQQSWKVQKSLSTFKALFLFYLELGKVDEAKQLVDELESFKIEDEGVELVSCYAKLYSEEGNTTRAVEYILEASKSRSDNDLIWLLYQAVIACFGAEKYNEAIPIGNQLVNDFPNSPEGYLAVGICNARGARIKEAVDYFNEAESRAENAINSTLTWYQLGMEYTHIGEHIKAAECFQMVENKGSSFDLRRKIITEYTRGGAYQRAISLCVSELKIAEKDIVLNKALYYCYCRTGDFISAESLIYNYLQIGDSNESDDFMLLGAQLQAEYGNMDKVVFNLLAIKDYSQFGMRERFWISARLIELGYLFEGCKIAYSVRLDYYDRLEAHENYFFAMSSLKQKEVFLNDFSEITLENAVTLEDEEKEVVNVLLTTDEQKKGINVYGAEDFIAKALLGKKIGDSINIPSKVGKGSRLTVVRIYSPFVFAFIESKELLDTRFSGETSMVTITPNQADDISLIKAFAKEHLIEGNKAYENILEMYNKMEAPLGLLSYTIEKHFFEVWARQIHSPGAFLFCYNHIEANELNTAIAKNCPVVIDSSALLTNFVLLKEYQLIENLNCPLFVSHSNIAELKKYKHYIVTSRSIGTMFVYNGEPIIQENSEEEKNRLISTIDYVIDWCLNNTTIISPSNSVIGSKGKSAKEAIGPAGLNSILLAKELNGFLLSDDSGLKAFALGEYQVQSFSTYQVALYQQHTDCLPKADFDKLSRILVRNNYAYIPVLSENLWAMFSENNFQVRYPFTNATRGFKIMSPMVIGNVIASFARILYSSQCLQYTREAVILFLLAESHQYSDINAIISYVRVFTTKGFALMPIQLTELFALLDSYSSNNGSLLY